MLIPTGFPTSLRNPGCLTTMSKPFQAISTPPDKSFNTCGITFPKRRVTQNFRVGRRVREHILGAAGGQHCICHLKTTVGNPVDWNHQAMCVGMKRTHQTLKRLLVGTCLRCHKFHPESIWFIMYHDFEWFINITSYNWDNKQRREALNFGTCSVNQFENRWTYHN